MVEEVSVIFPLSVPFVASMVDGGKAVVLEYVMFDPPSLAANVIENSVPTYTLPNDVPVCQTGTGSNETAFTFVADPSPVSTTTSYVPVVFGLTLTRNVVELTKVIDAAAVPPIDTFVPVSKLPPPMTR